MVAARTGVHDWTVQVHLLTEGRCAMIGLVHPSLQREAVPPHLRARSVLYQSWNNRVNAQSWVWVGGRCERYGAVFGRPGARDVVRVSYDSDTGEVAFELNGEALGAAPKRLSPPVQLAVLTTSRGELALLESCH